MTMTQGGTQTHNLANVLYIQLSYWVIWQLSGWVWVFKADLPGSPADVDTKLMECLVQINEHVC